jgi:hypothetical protein
VADPEVLHTNPNVPQDADGTGSEALFAGLNDGHEILVQAKTLVGNSELVDGPAEAIIPLLPLKLDHRNLYLDQSAFDATNAALAALTARVAADEELIAANAAAIATNTAAIASLQQQVAAVNRQLHDLISSLKPGTMYPYADADMAGAGAMLAQLGHYAHLTNLANLSGAGGLSGNLGKVPKELFPGTVIGTGAMAKTVLSMLAMLRATLPGAGQLLVDATVKSLIVQRGDWAGLGVGMLTAPTVMTMQARAGLAGTGTMAATGMNQLLRSGQTFAGGGAVSGNVVIGASAFDPATISGAGGTGGTLALSNNNRTVTFTGSYPQAAGVRGTKSQNSGKRYIEFRLDSGGGVGNTAGCGVCVAGFSIAAQRLLGGDSQSWAVIGQGNANTWVEYFAGNAWSTQTVPVQNGDIISMCLDIGAGKINFAINNVWMQGGGSVSAGPPTASDISISPGQTLYPIVYVDKSISTWPVTAWTVNFGQSPFVYTPPAGYVAWG